MVLYKNSLKLSVIQGIRKRIQSSTLKLIYFLKVYVEFSINLVHLL